MISKKIVSRVGSKNKLSRLIEYLTDPQGKTERVAAIKITNCYSEEIRLAVIEMQATQGLNTRAQGNKTYHLVISLTQGENLAPDALADIENRFCKILGLEEHQRISVLHRDTDHLHLHVAINKIHPTRLTMKEPFHDYRKREILCRQIEKEYELVHACHEKKPSFPSQDKAATMEAVAGLESLAGYVTRQLKEATLQAQSWKELHEAFAKAGVSLKERGNGFVVDAGEIIVKASSCFRELSKAALEKRMGPFRPAPEAAILPEKNYQTQPLAPGNSALYEQFKISRESAKQQRTAEIEMALSRHRERIAKAKDIYNLQKGILSLSRRGVMKAFSIQLTRRTLKASMDASFEKYKAERSEIFQKAKLFSWNDWLIKETERGNIAALDALHARQQPRNHSHPQIHRATSPGSEPEYATRSDIVRDKIAIPTKTPGLANERHEGR